MENHYTDTQSQRPSQSVVKYWMDIDRTDMELSGLPLKYRDANELVDSLGVEDSYERVILSRIRKAQAATRHVSC